MHRGILKAELQSKGVRLNSTFPKGRLGGAGPAEGITLSINGSLMTVPTYSPYVQESPYYICAQDSSFYLYHMNEPVDQVVLMDNANFYQGVTSDGHLFSKIALVHGQDCLASTVIQRCSLWGGSQACRFCGIGMSLKNGLTVERKTPQQLAEVATAARQNGINHMLMTSGSSVDGHEEIVHLAACTHSIKQAVDIPVQVQCRPPADLTHLKLLKEVGVDTIGIHIESLDDEVLEKIAPAKAGIGWDGYLRAWSQAVDLFGRGQVLTFIIVGLGERLSVMSNRLRELAGLGVYPFVVPLRPIPGTTMGDTIPPNSALMRKVYEETAEVLDMFRLSSREIKAGCGRCTACSALPDFEEVYKLG